MITIEQLYQLFLQHPHISTDTRQLIPNSLFFALKGDNFDANLFAANAIDKGCAYAIVDNPSVVTNKHFILVDNVLKTLQQLALYHRQQLAIPILAITGTNGKTTTKELVGRVLSKKYTIGITVGNLNNHIGVPLTLLSMNKATTFGVVEMGANHIGEIAELCHIAQPNYGLITNVGKAHLEGFGSLEGVKSAKGELYNYLQQTNGTAFVNTDDANLQAMANARKNLQVLPYSASLYNAQLLSTDNQNPFLNVTLSPDIKITTSLLGAYNLNNIVAAVAVGLQMGVDMSEITDAISSYKPDNNRSQLIRTPNNTLYMDAYNANPSSMEVSIYNFSQLNEANKLLIVGDMLELGADSIAEHQRIVKQINDAAFAQVWVVGTYFAQVVENNNCYKSFQTINELINHLKSNPVSNYTILIKGSRGIHLEKALDYL